MSLSRPLGRIGGCPERNGGCPGRIGGCPGRIGGYLGWDWLGRVPRCLGLMIWGVLPVLVAGTQVPGQVHAGPPTFRRAAAGSEVEPPANGNAGEGGEPAEDRDSPRSTEWLAGRDLERQLSLPAGWNWKALELRAALEGLAASQRVAIFLDRRIDPSQQVDFSSAGRSLEETLQQVAARHGAAVGLIGPVVYVGPRDEVDRIATTAALHAQRLTEPKTRNGRWQRKTAWRWPALTAPGELLENLEAELQIPIQGKELVPHDLWPAADLPPMPLCDRLSLLLAGFGLTYAPDEAGRAVRLVPLPDDPKFQQSYALPPNAAPLLARFRRQVPSADVRQEGVRVVMEGTWSEHRRLESLLREAGGAGRRVSPARQRYTLRVENKTVGSVAKALAAQLNRQLEISPQANPALRQLVSFQVQDATLEALLHAVFDPVSLRFEVDDQRIRVLPPTR